MALFAFESTRGTILSARDVTAIEKYLKANMDRILSLVDLIELWDYYEDAWAETIYKFDFTVITMESTQ